MKPDLTLDDMTRGLAAAWERSQTPGDLRSRIVAWAVGNREHVDRLEALVGATVAWWIIKGSEAGHDRDMLDQVALQTTHRVIARIARTMKARQGEPYEPARIAIVAYAIAHAMDDGSGPLDLEAIAGAIDAVAADTEAENARLRELIDEIADMDIGEPEIEHREIIARCRAEQRRWYDDEEEAA